MNLILECQRVIFELEGFMLKSFWKDTRLSVCVQIDSVDSNQTIRIITGSSILTWVQPRPDNIDLYLKIKIRFGFDPWASAQIKNMPCIGLLKGKWPRTCACTYLWSHQEFSNFLKTSINYVITCTWWSPLRMVFRCLLMLLTVYGVYAIRAVNGAR